MTSASDFKHFLNLASSRPLSGEEAEAAFEAILSGAPETAQIAAFLMALKVRGETVDEIAAAARVLRANATLIEAPDDAVDTCGTGGDGANTFNISTAAAIVAAGAGARVAKHGNKSVSSKSGSSEVLAALGVRLDAPRTVLERCLAEAGLCFLYAPLHHPAVKNAAPARAALGLRTIFNLIGPLANPAGATRQVMGVYAEALVEPVAETLLRLGAQRAWVVHGRDGLDEITTTDETLVASATPQGVTTFIIKPSSLGLAPATLKDLEGGDPDDNARAILKILGGAAGPYRDITVLNAAAALVVAGKAADLPDGLARAGDAIDSGRAKAALDALVAISNTGDA